MSTKMTALSYTINDDGSTKAISVTLTGYENGESVNVVVILTAENLDDLTRKEIETQARSKASEYVLNTEPTK